MAETTTIEQFKKVSSAILDWRGRKDKLVTRQEWGDQSFKDVKPQMELIFKMTNDLASLPVELIEESTLSALNEFLDRVRYIFQEIDDYSTSDIVNNRDAIANDVRGLEGSIRDHYRTEVPWLATYSGTSENWLSAARDEQKRTKEIREEAERHLAAAKDAANIARESAGESGAAEFTGAFRDQATKADESAAKWLKATAWAFGLALFATVIFVALHACDIPPSPTTKSTSIGPLAWRT